MPDDVYAAIPYVSLCPVSRPDFEPLDAAPKDAYRQSRCIDRQDSPASPGSPSQVLYTIVRADLPLGVQVAQTAHAASEASGYPPTIVVALAVPDETALKRIAEALGENSLTYALITEEDGPFSGQVMALGVTPSTDRAAIRKVVSALPLVR